MENKINERDTEIKLELEALSKCSHQFRQKMYEKLADKALRGYRGWNYPTALEDHKRSLIIHAARVCAGEKNQTVDIANLAMMIDYLERKEDYGKT